MTLTMSLGGNTHEFRRAGLDASFRSLWTPVGRGFISRTEIIDWIDFHRGFKIGPFTLQEWSQTPVSAPSVPNFGLGPWTWHKNWRVNAGVISVLPSVLLVGSVFEGFRFVTERSEEVRKALNEALENSIGSEMKLAELQKFPSCSSSFDNFEAALVHPHTKINDEVFFVRGCSIPVTMRKTGDDSNSYTVVGGAWVYVHRTDTPALTRYQDWAYGRDDNLDSAEISVLSLI